MSKIQSELMKQNWIKRKAEGFVVWNKGKTLPPHSEETKRKMSLARKGKPNAGTFTKGHLRRVGLKHSDEAKLKMSESHKQMTEETRLKMSIAQTGKTGELASNWRGGITPLFHQIRTSFQYRQWRCDVFTRDNFTCLKCGDSKGGNLNADHKIAFIVILRSYQIKTMEEALKCQKLWDINNGQTLCEPCHRKTDTYGQNAKTMSLIEIEQESI